MNVLVAIDNSPFSETALKEVAGRVWPGDSKFKLLHVVEPFHPEFAGWHTSYVPVAIQAQKELLDGARKLIADRAEKLGESLGKERVESEVKEGYVQDTILETAKEWPADLIVVGSHGRKGLTKFLLGSVSEAVVAHAPCSVEIVRMPAGNESGAA